MRRVLRPYFRIVRDDYLGFEVQSWRWWFPFWVQSGFCNTHKTRIEAEEYACRKANPVVVFLGQQVRP